jgi:hypothetical protein
LLHIGGMLRAALRGWCLSGFIGAEGISAAGHALPRPDLSAELP